MGGGYGVSRYMSLIGPVTIKKRFQILDCVEWTGDMGCHNGI